MAKKETYEILSNEALTKDIFKMILKGDGTWVNKPGRFMEIEVKDLYLKRPISICDHTDDSITLIYKVVGQGTKILSTLPNGSKLECLVDLGNGFDIDVNEDKIMVVGGGVGVPPLYDLCKSLVKIGKNVTVILGFQSKDDIFYKEEFENLNVKLFISTNDGSYGTKGFVTDIIKNEKLENTYYMACGPLPMLKGLYDTCSNAKGQLSLEERMGCGFGACMGCSHKTKNGYKRVCVEGPIFTSEEILWED